MDNSPPFLLPLTPTSHFSDLFPSVPCGSGACWRRGLYWALGKLLEVSVVGCWVLRLLGSRDEGEEPPSPLPPFSPQTAVPGGFGVQGGAN